MQKILKVFAEKSEIPAVLRQSKLIERYDAFILVEASEADARALARRYPAEDITSQYQLRIGGRLVDTSHPRVTTAGETRPHPAYRGVAKLAQGPHHYVVQFSGPIKSNWLARVRASGARLRGPYGNFGYIVRARESAIPKISGLPFVRWMGHLPHRDRVAASVLEPASAEAHLPRRRVQPGAYSVEIFDSQDARAIARSARALGFKVLSQDARAPVLLLETDSPAAARRRQIKALSAVHGVRFIRPRVVPRTCNNVATAIMGNVYAATAANGLKLSGDGETVAVCDTGLDTGDPASIHPDFAGRIAAIRSYPITPEWDSLVLNPGADDGPADFDSGHGTHVAGSVLGNGAASASGPALIRGHAHGARLVFQAVEQEMRWRPNAPPELSGERYLLAGIPSNLKPLFQFAYSQGARIHSNSWGGGDPGAYDDQCRQFDEFVWNHKDLCFVVAAGNDGTDSDGDGKINATSVSSPATAKNCITVGACENFRPEFVAQRYGDWWAGDFPANPIKSDPMSNDPNQVVAFSSRGPTLDHRVKPDVVAPGTFILSTRSTRLAPNNFAWGAYPPNKKYFHMGGTSMATPLTAGAAAVLREFLRKKRGIASPSAALVKALLVAGAQRLPATGPAGAILDNHQGFGRVDLDRSLKQPLATIEGPGLRTGQKSTFTVKVPVSNKTLRLALCYSDFPGESLVNNLSLIVRDPSGKRYVGNQPASRNGLTLDATNNIEVVQVAKAGRGNWTADVVASSVPSGPQDFALVAVLV